MSLVKREDSLPAVKASDMLSVIAAAVSNPDLDVAKMQALLNMHMQITVEQQKVAFAAALSRLQAKLPQIEKSGRIVVKGTERSRYAKIEDVDLAIKPLLTEEGFALSFDTDSTDGKLFKISCTLSHAEGHEKTKSIVLPMDASDYRSNVQSIGSTVSYGKRQLIKMHLNIVEKDEDNDGAGSEECITADQVKDILTLLRDTKSDEKKFLELIAGVGKIEDIQSRDFKRVMNALETKARAQK